MPVDIGPKIGIDGEAQYTRSLKNIIQQSKELQSEMRRVASEFDDADTSQEKLDAQMRILNRQIENQQDRVAVLGDRYKQASRRADDLKDELARVVKEFGDTSREAQQAANALDRQETAASKAKTEYNSARTALNKMQRELRQTENPLDDLSDAFGSASDSAKSFADIVKGSFIGNLAADIVSDIGNALIDFASNAASASDSLKKFESTMRFAGFDDDTISKTMEDMQDYANRTIYDLETVSNTVAQLGANGVENFEELTEAAGNLNAVAGGNADTFQSVAQVLTQTAGAGKLTTENWNQLTDAIPGASGVLQQAMLDAGAYTGNFREAMENGEISAEEFNAALLELGESGAAQEAATSVSTIEGALGNLQATIEGIMTSFLQNGVSDLITGAINGITSAIQAAVDFVTAHGDEINSFLSGAKETLYTIGTQIMPYLQQFFDYFSGRVQNELELWNKLKDRIDEFISAAQSIWTTIQPYVQPLIDFYGELISAQESWISQAWDSLSSFFGNLSSSGWGMLNDVASWYESVVQWSMDMANGLIDGFNSVVDFFSGLASSAYDWASDMISGFVDGINSGIKWVEDAASGIADTISSWLHFSRPDVGPLRYYEQWMPDMMSTMARQIDDNIGLVTAALSHMTDQMAITIPAAQPMSAVRVAATQTSGPAPIINLTVNGAPGQDVNALADIVMQKIQAATDRKGAVWG